MKAFTAVMALATLFTLTAHASETCHNIASAWNSHPVKDCPAITSICVNDADESKITLGLADGGAVVNAQFGGYQIENQSDVGQILYNHFTLPGIGWIDVILNNDGSWPATRLPGIDSLELYGTGVTSTTGVYRSQICIYRL